MSGVLVDREALEARIREELERNWPALPYATPHGLAASLAAALALPAQAAADAAGMGDAERLAYHRAEMDRLDETGRGVKDYERRQAHMNCLEGLAQRIKGTERLEAGEARLRALADALEVQG